VGVVGLFVWFGWLFGWFDFLWIWQDFSHPKKLFVISFRAVGWNNLREREKKQELCLHPRNLT